MELRAANTAENTKVRASEINDSGKDKNVQSTGNRLLPMLAGFN